MKYYPSIFLLIVISTFGFSCNSNENIEFKNSTRNKIKSLKESPYPFGAAINITNLKNIPSYDSLVNAEFNSITAENTMKMASISTGKDKYYWNDVDYIVDFASQNDIRIHGHCLVWHQSIPSWLNKFTGTKEEWETILKNYITTVVSKYKGKIASWDVVNEALLDNGTPRIESIWYKNIGWKYVELAFIYAHDADPDAVLFYNDYGQEYSTIKLNAINDTIRNMINRGIPIDGIGLQMHTNINQSTDLISNAINQTALISTSKEKKIKVHVSELDVALNPNKNINYIINSTDLEAQKARYRIIAATMRALPKEQNWGITTWGVIDSDSWLKNNPDFPLIFDNNFNPKPCYKGILDALSIH